MRISHRFGTALLALLLSFTAHAQTADQINGTRITAGTVADKQLATIARRAVDLVAVANLTLSGEQTIDGVLTSGSVVNATAQTTQAQRGPWITASGAWTRPAWYASGNTKQAFKGIALCAGAGTTYSGTCWQLTTAGTITIDTTATTWSIVTLSLNTNTETGLAPVALSGSAADLSSGQFATGRLPSTIPCANQPALTGDVTTSAGSCADTISANTVTNAKAAQMAANTVKGNNTGGTANAADLTQAQITALLNAFVGDSGSGGTKGLVPAPAAGDAAAGKVLCASGGYCNPGGSGNTVTDYQVFTANGTWTRPSFAQNGVTHIYVIGAGGGGGSGRSSTASGAATSGGGGGSSGGFGFAQLPTNSLASTVAVTVGTGGGGGTAVATNNNGVIGTAGGNSSFGSLIVGNGGGGGGSGRSSAASTGGGTAGTATTISGTPGAIAQTGINGVTSNQGLLGVAGTDSTLFHTGASGGSGAGIAVTPVNLAGGAGGSNTSNGLAGGSAGASTPTAGGTGAQGDSSGKDAMGGAGGGGGGSNTAGAASAGGNGGRWGAGGGGGGAAVAGNSGAGGSGANGLVLVISIGN